MCSLPKMLRVFDCAFDDDEAGGHSRPERPSAISSSTSRSARCGLCERVGASALPTAQSGGVMLVRDVAARQNG
jgi:hypothetical protein